MKNFHYVVWEEGKWFIARCLEVEVASQGSTEKAATKNLMEALELYFEDDISGPFARVENPKVASFSLANA